MLASLLGGAASLVGGILGGNAQDRAAKRSLKFNKQMYNEGVARNQPFVDFGTNALSPYANALGLGDSQAAINQFQNSPNYLLNFQTGLDNANNQLMRQAAAGGSINSGRTLMGLQDRGTNIANQFYGNYLSGLGNAVDIGRGAVQNTNAFAQGQGQQVSNDMYNRGNAQAAGYLGMGNSINNALGDWQQQQNLNKILNSSSSYSSPNFFGGLY